MIVKDGWLHLKVGGPADWVRVFASLEERLLSLLADPRAAPIIPDSSCLAFDLAPQGHHVAVAGEMLMVWRSTNIPGNMQCDFLCASSAEEAEDWARAVEVTGGVVERKQPFVTQETQRRSTEEYEPELRPEFNSEVEQSDDERAVIFVRDSDCIDELNENRITEELDERINQSLSTTPASLRAATRTRGSICKLNVQSSPRFHWRNGVFAFKCSNRTVIMKPEGLSEAMEGDWIVCDEDGDVFAVNAVKFDHDFVLAPGSRKNHFRRVSAVFAKQMTEPFIAVNDEVVYHGHPGDYLVQNEDGHQWVCVGIEFDLRFTPAPELSPRPSSATQDLALGTASGAAEGTGHRDTDETRATSPSDVLKMDLTPKISKWYVRRATVHAFKSKDPAACKKSWGWDQSDTGDWLIFMNDDDAAHKVMTCSAADFEQTYSEVENQPHKYREKGKVLALRMQVNFAAVRSGGFQMGMSGDYLVQDEFGNQWVAAPSVFLKQYSPAPEQTKDDADDNDSESMLDMRLRSNLRDIAPMSRAGTLWNVLLPTESKHDDELCWSGSLLKRSRHFKQWRKRYFRLYADSFGYSRHAPNEDGSVPDEFPIDLHACEIESLEMDGKDIICIRPFSHRGLPDTTDPNSVSPRESFGSSNAGEASTTLKAGKQGRQPEPETVYLQAASERQHAMLIVLLKSGVVNATKQRIFEACKNDDAQVFDRLLQGLAEEDCFHVLHTPNSNGDWIVHVAAQGNAKVLAALLVHTNEFNRLNRAGLSPLYLAASSGNAECVTLLLEEGASSNLETKNGETALHAALNGEVVSTLLEYGAAVNIEDHYGRTPLMTAALKGSVSAVTALLDAGAIINAQSWRTGYCALHFAVQAMKSSPAGAQSVVELLLLQGAKATIAELHSQTSLHIACHGYVTACTEGLLDSLPSYAQCIRALLDARSDVTALDQAGHTSFAILCKCKPHPPLDTYAWCDLLDMTLGLNDPQSSWQILHDSDQSGRSCLHIAAAAGNITTVRYLLEKEADINAKEMKGLTPLDVLNKCLSKTADAAELERLRACEALLIEHGGYKRRKASLPVEEDRSDIKFTSGPDGSCSVKAATFETLVMRVCNSLHYEDVDALALVLCYRVVSSDERLLELLIEHLQRMYADNRERSRSNSEAEAYGAHSYRPILRLMGQWFEMLSPESLAQDSRVVQLLVDLTTLLLQHDGVHAFSAESRGLFQEILNDETPARATRLVDAWKFHCSGLKVLAKFSVASTNVYRPTDILRNLQSNSSKIQHIIRLAMQQQLKSAKVLGVAHGASANHGTDPNAPGICAYKPFDIAQQLSVAAHYLFRKIELTEFLSLKYSDTSITPNIAVLKQWNERCIGYFMHEILIRPSPDKRADVICHLIRVAQQLMTVVMNHDAVMIIMQVLEATSIYRLKQTWARVNRKLPKAWDEIKEQCGIGGRKLTRLAGAVPASEPFMPYVGTIMQVLVNLHEMPSMITANEPNGSSGSASTEAPSMLIHVAKWRRIAEMAQNIFQWQQTPYLIEVNPDLQFLFQSTTPFHDEARQAKRSEELEPPLQAGKSPPKSTWFAS